MSGPALRPKQPLNVKMVIGQLWPSPEGGAEHQAKLLAKQLLQLGVRLEIFTSRPRGVPARLPEDEVPVRRLWGGYGPARPYLLMAALYRTLVSRRERVDLIHIHQGLFPAFAAARAGRRRAVPTIVKCGNSGSRFDLDLLSQERPFGKAMAGAVARQISCFVGLNREAVAQLAQWRVEPDRIELIPNGVALEPAITDMERAKSRDCIGVPPSDRVLVSLGSLSPKKDFSTLLRAIGQLRETLPVRLLLVGDGPLAATLREEAETLGVADYVQFVGAVPHPETRRFLAAADLFVLPSVTEGLSNALLEAMSTGLPCVVSDIPGNRMLVDDRRTGILFEPGDAGSLARAMQLVLTDSELRAGLGQRGRKQIQANFGIRAVADRYLELYDRLLERGA